MPVMQVQDAPDFSWENIEVGDTLGRVEGAITEDAVRAHAFAINDDPERYLGSHPGGLVPPTLLSNELLKMFFLGYELPPRVQAGLHTRSQIEYFEPLRVGEPVILTGSHVAKYVKRGRRLRCQECQVSRPDGSLVARMLATETVGYEVHDEPDQGDIPYDWSRDLPRVSVEVPEGASVFGDQWERVSYEQSVMFSGLPFEWARRKPGPVRQGTHTNSISAAQAGFEKPIVQGLLISSHLTRILLEHFGSQSLFGSQLAFTFINPLLVGESFNIRGMSFKTKETKPNDDVQLLATTADGTPLTVGHARIKS